MNSSQVKKILTEAQAAELIGMSFAWLQQVRLYECKRRGFSAPPHLRIGRSIRYEASELNAWMDQFRVGNQK